MKKTWAGSMMRVSRTVSACVSGEKRGNWSATSASACHQSTSVAAALKAPIVPATLASRRAAASGPCCPSTRE